MAPTPNIFAPVRYAAQVFYLLLIGLLLLGAGAVAYRMAKSQVAAEVYQARLSEMRSDYEELRGLYNDAIRRTAVTELLVRDGVVCVVIRNAAGETQVIETPFSSSREIYIDYVVVEGRLWIRRVFDDRTSPEKGVLIDPKLASVDWGHPAAAHGKAVYRRLSEGRWVITVTGDGSLGLAQVPEDASTDLVAAPPVQDHATVEREAAAAAESVSLGDVLRHLLR